MGRGPIVGDLRVQRIERSDGGWSFTVVWPDGAVHEDADRFLRRYEGSGTQRSYAYLLVDHLRWLERECLPLGSVTGAFTATGVRMPESTTMTGYCCPSRCAKPTAMSKVSEVCLDIRPWMSSL